MPPDMKRSGAWAAALLSPPFATLTYLHPEGFSHTLPQPGMRFLAPVGQSLRVVLLLHPTDPTVATDQGLQLKPLLWPLEQDPLLRPGYLELVRQLSLRQLHSQGQILGSLLPLPLRTSKVRYSLPFAGRARTLTPRDLAQLPPQERAELALAWQERRMRVHDAAVAAEDVARVVNDPPWPVRPSATRQLAVLEYLWERGEAARRMLLADLGSSAGPVLNELVSRGLVELGPPRAGEDEELPLPDAADEPFDFTPQQLAALDGPEGLEAALCSPQGETRLLFGVTGSGKTAVYLELARRALALGRSVLLLAPEIALAYNLRRAALSRFPDCAEQVLLYHGSLPPQERSKRFRRAAEAQGPLLVVGTRSALFLPVADPGCVILDEEHDSSFKQDERLNYQAKEVGWFLARQHKGLLVLGSATPDVKTFYAARQGLTPCLSLPSRISDCGLPAIDLVDIRGLRPTEQLLAGETVAVLRETVARGEQAIIMLNRRGYSPLMYCLDCGRVAKCGHCDIGLTYHKGRERLVCHYCGQSRAFPLVCEGCGGCNYLPMGEGTERLEESMATALPPEARVLRLDRDSTRRPGRMEEILAAFARGEAQVLVGTQMLSKGHHFPNVTQVVVADGDLGLNLPDYRAAERTFQLLVQVAGRAGRGDKPGRVLIQTRDPAHACWQSIRGCDYESFYRAELALREKRRYPPFVKLALIRISYPLQWEPGPGVLAELARTARDGGKAEGVQVLGPAPAPLKLLRGRQRFHCLLKGADWQALRRVYAPVAAVGGGHKDLRLSLDLDPVDML